MGSIISAAPSVVSDRESNFHDSVISNKKTKRGATADNYYQKINKFANSTIEPGRNLLESL